MSLDQRAKKPRFRRAITAGVPLALGALALSGCSKVSGLGFEEGLSSVNDTSLDLWQGAWIAAGVVGVFTAGLILWSSIFHRKKNEEFPKQTQYHIPIEVAYTVIPFIIVAVLFAYTAKDESEIMKKTTGAAHEISVNAIQWSWQFGYEEAGDSAIVTGTPDAPPVLYMPQGEKVRFTLTASDVVHGFWIPAFMIQMQNLPGVTNHLEFTANKLGDYPGRCNILCGRDHSRMYFTVRVVTPTQYQEYLTTLKASQA
jgi:cytochrome c oxidase subunit 2